MAGLQKVDQDVEARGSAAMAFLVSGTIGQEQRKSILRDNGIDDLNTNGWYQLSSIIGAFDDLSSAIGEMNLFMIGKSIMEQAEFPPMEGLENALKSIDVAYHMNHRKNGKAMFDPKTGRKEEGIGHYRLAKFDLTNREAEMVCTTPYPSKFEEGLIVQIVRMFKPSDSIKTKVTLDTSKETRRKGGRSCTFKIMW